MKNMELSSFSLVGQVPKQFEGGESDGEVKIGPRWIFESDTWVQARLGIRHLSFFLIKSTNEPNQHTYQSLRPSSWLFTSPTGTFCSIEAAYLSMFGLVPTLWRVEVARGVVSRLFECPFDKQRTNGACI